MGTIELKHSQIEENENILRVNVVGQIDSLTNDQFDEYVTKLIKDGNKYIILELEALSFLSSSGIGTIIGFLDQLEEIDGKIAMLNTPSTIMKSLQLVGVTELIQNYSIEQDAIDAVS